jgi:hypothetical protein
MYAHQLRSGTLAGTRRVRRFGTGLRNGRPVITVVWSDGTRDTFGRGDRVPGTRPLTDLPAGPVPSGKGFILLSRGGNREDSAADRHAAMVTNITYVD